MIILQKGRMEDGTIIQIEDWSGDYSFMEYGRTIGAYPIAKIDYDGEFEPKKGEKTRMQYDFKSNDEAVKFYTELIEGIKTLKDIENNLYDKRYRNCI